MMSFGGGLAAWTRREVVQKRGWLDDKRFVSGYALSQLVPGATNVNLAVFISSQMRGAAGAIACFCGLSALTVASCSGSASGICIGRARGWRLADEHRAAVWGQWRSV